MLVYRNYLAVLFSAFLLASCTMSPGFSPPADYLAQRCGAAECEEKAKVQDDFVRDTYMQKGGEVPVVEKVVPVVVPAPVAVVPGDDWCPTMSADALFDFDKYELKPAGRVLLDTVAEALVKCPTLILKMSGHTDSIGTMQYNTVLSQRRVEAGRNYLLQKGVAPERISVSWHSFNKPVAPNDTPEGRAKNRRLELEYIDTAKVK
jgi:outer membrane protein OmpA-like peptidoglycan-associated protein